MPKICYIDKNFTSSTLLVIAKANEIIWEYAEQGFDLTLRQLYYQFVARDVFPEDRRWNLVDSRWVRDPSGTKNAEPNYKWLGSIVNNARLAGYIDWERIVDRTRELRGLAHWGSPEAIVSAAARGYQIDMWERQLCRIEVWIEKDALAGVFDKVCSELDVPFFSCRGYTSQTEMWRAAQRFLQYSVDDQVPYVLHLGDHDPSGIDMTRDIRDRLELFTDYEIAVERLALNWDQVEEYSPPPNPTKLSDSRASAYIANFGLDSWELDAMEPRVLADLVRSAVTARRDDDIWKEDLRRLKEERKQLEAAAIQWENIVKFLDDGPAAQAQ